MSWSGLIGHGIAHGAMGEGLRPLTTGLGYATNSIAPIEAPSAQEAMDLARRGWITEHLMTTVCRMHGIVCDPGQSPGDPVNNPGDGLRQAWNAIYYAGQELPPQAELREIANRQLWAPGVLEKRLQQYGYYTASTRDWVGNLRFDIPGPADLVRFSVRHFWEPDLLKQFGYADEFPGEIIDVWHAMKGLDYPLFTGPFESQINQIYGFPEAAQNLANYYENSVGSEPTWAKAYWYSHWVLPSPTQGYLMWQRLASDRNPKWDAPEMIGQNFDIEDLRLLLRANDYPPYWRDKLAAISHPIPGIRFMRDFVKNNVYEYADIVEWGRRQGYSPLDSKNIADDVWTAIKGQQQAKADVKCLALAKNAYLAGIMSYQDLLNAITSCGSVAGDAADIADAIVLQRQIQRAKQTVSSIRSRYLKGRLSDDDALRLLGQAGINPDRAREDVDDWQLERDATGKEATLAQASKWACDGFITLADFQARAQNLGYQPVDVQPIVMQVEQCQSNLLAKAQAALVKAEQQAAKQQQAAIKAAAQRLKQCQRSLSSHGTPGDLRKWYCQGFITESEVASRLRFMGWPLTDISRLIADCAKVTDAKLPGLGGRLASPGPDLTESQVCPPTGG